LAIVAGENIFIVFITVSIFLLCYLAYFNLEKSS